MRRPAGPSIETLREAATAIALEADCRLVVLFGSTARASSEDGHGSVDGRPPEDVDLALRADGAVDALELTNRFIRALGVQEVDLVDLSRADPLVMMLVARDGIPLYEREGGEFARFASLAARRYADTRKFREAERDAIRDFIAEGPSAEVAKGKTEASDARGGS